MEDISLSTILNNDKKNKENIGNISINSLLLNDHKKEVLEKSNINDIIDIKNEFINKKIDLYELEYNKCINNLVEYAKFNRNEMIYNIPLVNVFNENYNWKECLLYVKEKLEKDKLLVVSKDNQIFITIKYLHLIKH